MIWLNRVLQDTKKYYILEVVPLVNRKLKAQVIEYGLVQVVNKMNKAFYKQSLRETMPFPEAIKDSKYDMPFNEAIETYDSLISSDEGWAMLQEANRVIHANNARKNRVKKRIDALLQKPCVFLTFTFYIFLTFKYNNNSYCKKSRKLRFADERTFRWGIEK